MRFIVASWISSRGVGASGVGGVTVNTLATPPAATSRDKRCVVPPLLWRSRTRARQRAAPAPRAWTGTGVRVAVATAKEGRAESGDSRRWPLA